MDVRCVPEAEIPNYYSSPIRIPPPHNLVHPTQFRARF